jgi:transcriptional regulator with XRE-family HTH domain
MPQETQGERLRRARDERGLKQGYVARVAGITQAHLSRIENDESGVTDFTLKKLAQAIGIPFEDLVVRDNPKKDDGPRVVNIDDVLSSEAAMVRFMGGERPDNETFEWVKRSLQIIRSEIKRRKDF